MKLNFLKLRTKNQLRKNKTQRSSIPFKKAERIGLLFTIEDRNKHDHIKQFIHKLEQEGKKVQAFAFLPPKKENYEFLFDFFTPQEVSFCGSIKSDHALRFADTAFDYLFCLDKNPNDYICYLLARSKARCRAGIYSEQLQPYFELMVNGVKSTSALIEHIHQYTQKLK
ncbi:MAG: hypothetical protein NZM13_04220 [Cyclobacteriaceae bacterium]|nr:hypothetical protein [Cyclobacteriaceae bacterium]MDW8330901.1 hypothetical protein [Cyclobacteriaceae bacterium]